MEMARLMENLEIDPKTMPLDFWQEALDASHRDDSGGEAEPEQIRAICEWVGFRPELTAACFEAAREIQTISEAGEFLRAVRYIVLHRFADPRINTMPWPKPCESRWASPTMFYVVMFLSCVPDLRERHRRQGLPESATRDILLDLESKIDIHIRLFGRPGLNTFRWFAEHFNGQIFQLRRLQFQFLTFPYAFEVYKHVSEGKLAVLATAGQKFRSDGQYFDADRRMEGENGVRTTVLKEEAEWLEGTPITPRGCAGSRVVRLKREDWKLVLKSGDAVLNVHIPANTGRNGPLTREACVDSYRQALTFFAQYFPDFKFGAFMCRTWMLDPQLADYLPASSNIVQFQKGFHLFPLPTADDSSMINFVFGNPFPGWEAAPQKSSLQEIAVCHVRAGKCWRITGGFVLREEIAGDKKYDVVV